jgi:hypothetical protein
LLIDEFINFITINGIYNSLLSVNDSINLLATSPFVFSVSILFVESINPSAVFSSGDTGT